MKRRSFLAGIIASAAAPAIVRASSLMPIVVPRIIAPDGFRIPEFGWDKGWKFGDRTVIAEFGVEGWMPSDGRVIARADYPALWEVVYPNIMRCPV